ncbi:hypothetical protein BGZ50_003688 [Haplosporangium sp. Z 11]|nr:hypothetical protein BGZ50_003688 [Haplosporangium sp. Z 11]
MCFNGPYYQQLLLFNIREERWSEITTTGEQPGAVKNACMASASNGDKLVLFGGELERGSNRGDIFILDTKTWVWKKGPAAGLDQARFAMACTATATSFIAFGGDNMNNSPHFQDMIIFNLQFEIWTSMFIEGPKAPLPPSPTTRNIDPNQPTQSRWPIQAPSPSSDSSEDSKPSNKFNVAIVAGGAGAAGVVILVSIILLIICRRNKSRRKNASSSKSMHGIYPDKNYRGTESIRLREWVDGRPDRQRHTNQVVHMNQTAPTNQVITNLSPKAVRRAPRNDTSPYGHHPSFPLPPLSPPSTVYSAGSPTLVSSPSSTNSQSYYKPYPTSPETYKKSTLESPPQSHHKPYSTSPETYKKSTLESPPLNDSEPHRAKARRPQGYSSAQATRGQQHPRNPQRQSVMTPLQQTWEYQQQQTRNPQCNSSSRDQEEEEEGDNIPPPLADKPYSIQRNAPSTLSPLPETWELQRGQQNPQYLPTPSPWTQSIVPYPSPTSPWDP